jgi:type I restriction-modification system DNA methylase subunit
MRTDEVVPEQTTLVGRADFGLRVLNELPDLYVECKKFSESLDGYRIERGRKVTYPEKAVQYAWSMKADWAVLTNFKELRLYWTRAKSPEKGLVVPVIRLENYLDRFDDLWLISKQSIIKGILDIYRRKAERNYVDEEFLRDLLECRALLIQNIHQRNPNLSVEELNECAQRILDRFIFIRSCEDRGIIASETLWKHFQHWQEVAIDKSVRTFMTDLKNMFRDFDQVYDSKIFEPHMSEDLKLDNEVLEEILKRFYGDEDKIGYRFDAVPVDVLGQAYELYISSVIKEKEGVIKSIEIVEDYAKRQKHGIYYTPAYVVDFIIRRTVGQKLMRAESLEQFSSIRVLDPACGSGSFLIKVFEAFLKHYQDFEKKTREGKSLKTLEPHLPLVPDVEKRILSENIYGVDLDPQAVDISMLNLGIKAVRSKGRLPYIGDRLVLGNTIVFPVGDLEKYFSNPALKHPTDYRRLFPEVFETGGFDVVVGNPPYIQMQRMPEEQKFCEAYCRPIYDGQNDVWYYFVYRGLQLLKPGGLLGLIVSRYFREAAHASVFRKYLVDNFRIRLLIDFGNVIIFRGINTRSIIIVIEKTSSPEELQTNTVRLVKIKRWSKDNYKLIGHIDQHLDQDLYEDESIEIFTVPQISLREDWTVSSPFAENIKRKMGQNSWSLGGEEGICLVGQGLTTGLNISKKERLPRFIVDEQTIHRYNLERQVLRRIVKSGDVKRYRVEWRGQYVIYTTHGVDIDDYPNARRYLKRFRDELEARYEFKQRLCEWYQLSNPRNREIDEAPLKLMVPYQYPMNAFAMIENVEYVGDSDTRLIAPKTSCSVNLWYILGILNSKLMNWYYRQIAKRKKAEFEYFTGHLVRIPIKRIDQESVEDRNMYESLAEDAQKMTRLFRMRTELLGLFRRLVKTQPTQPAKFGWYYQDGHHYSLSNKEMLIESGTLGTITNFSVLERDNTITIEATHTPKGEKTERREAVIRVTVDNPKTRRFLYYALKIFQIDSEKRKKLGEGKVLKVLLEQIVLPRFTANHEQNCRTIQQIMSQFDEKTPTARSLTEVENEIESVDEEIHDIVFKLYGLSESEAAYVKASLPWNPWRPYVVPDRQETSDG